MNQLQRLDAVPGSADMVGAYFAANETERKRYTRSVWRCSNRGHVLGFTLDVEGVPVLLSTVEANHAEYQWPTSTVSPADLQTLALEDFIELVVAGHLSYSDCQAQLRKISTRNRPKWFAADWQLATGDAFLSCNCREGYYPVETLLNAGKKALVKVEDLQSHPLNED